MSHLQETFDVRGHVRGSAICSSETMQALPDPADRNQAVIQNVPFFVDAINFGDVVRIGPPDDAGVRAIEAVAIPSGCVHFVVLVGTLSESRLIAHLGRLFPFPAVRIECGHGLLAVSVHPELAAEEVVSEIFDWFERQEPSPGDDDFGVTNLFESEIGPLGYPPGIP